MRISEPNWPITRACLGPRVFDLAGELCGMAANSSNGEGCWVLEKADHKQTDVVGDLAGLVLVAVGQAAVTGVVVPGRRAAAARPSRK